MTFVKNSSAPSKEVKYRISKVTNKRLPSKRVLHEQITATKLKLEELEKQLLEHLEVKTIGLE